jgi:hypothetical protein
MKKLLFALLIVATGCATEKPLAKYTDEDILKDDLNEAVFEFQKETGISKKDMYYIK